MGKIDENWLWNKRMGHISFDNLVNIIKKEVVRNMTKIIKTIKICLQALPTWEAGKCKIQDKGEFHIKAFRTNLY